MLLLVEYLFLLEPVHILIIQLVSVDHVVDFGEVLIEILLRPDSLILECLIGYSRDVCKELCLFMQDILDGSKIEPASKLAEK